MSTDTKVANLIINKGLTKAELNEKYQQGLIGDNELSIVDTEENVVQVDEMPVASASNVNSIVQFSGETTEDYTNGYFYKCILSDGVYSWTQINVQPGGGAGIEWETIVDLPATYSAGMNFTCPQFIVQGGLPDGNYEFYYQVKTRSNSGDTSAPFGVATYKIAVRLRHDNGQPYMVGSIAPVIDGDWMPSADYKIDKLSVYGCFYEDSGNFIIWSSELPFISDIGNLPNTFVPGCFKLSAIKNTDTGDEYIAAGIEPDGQHHHTGVQYGGSLQMDLIQATQTPASYFNTFAAPYGRRWFLLSGTYITVDEHFPSWCSECDISLISSSGGKWHIIAENTPDSYKINLLEASGDLANVQIGYNKSGTTILYINTPSDITGTVKGCIGVKGSTWTDVYATEIGQPDNFTQFIVNTVGGDISTNNYGSILQYTGVTDSNYTNGYFYKASGTPTTAPASMLCNETSGLGLTITCNDVEGFITALASNIGWDRTEVQSVLKHQVTVWEYTQSSNTLNWNWYGNVNPSLISYFDIVGPEVPASTAIQWTTSNYVAEGIVITNPSWERVDVQPAADPLPSQTGQSGKFLTTDGTDASWSDKPLVNMDNGIDSINIGGNSSTGLYDTNVGFGSEAGMNGSAFGYYASALSGGVANGRFSRAGATLSVAVGNYATATGDYSVAIGAEATASGNYSIQISSKYGYTNADDNTFKVGNNNGNFEMMSADGTIPHARLTNAIQSTTVTIATADWSSNTVSVTVSGLTATSVVWVAPDNASQSTYTTAGVYANSQSADTLVFNCVTTPTSALTINIVWC